MRNLLQKQLSGSKKIKKGTPTSQSEDNALTVALIYVNKQYDGWKEECFKTLQKKYDIETGFFKSDKDTLEELRESSLGREMNIKQRQKLCMSLIKFKMECRRRCPRFESAIR